MVVQSVDTRLMPYQELVSSRHDCRSNNVSRLLQAFAKSTFQRRKLRNRMDANYNR
jgi:hypothetical protein